jgi:hypothetical protein
LSVNPKPPHQTYLLLSLTAVVSIALIACLCVYRDSDGAITQLAIAAIAGLAGFSLRGLTRYN